MAKKQKPYSGMGVDEWSELDFDPFFNQIQTPLYHHRKLRDILSETSFIIRELGSYKTMSTMNKKNILIKARRAVNAFSTQYREIVADDALKMYRHNYTKIGKMLKEIGVKTTAITEPNWKEINTTLMDGKFQQLDYYTKRSVFMLERRMTLFELQGKKELQKNLINFIAQNRGSMGHDAMLRDLLKMLDKHYPAGYISIPVISHKDGKEILSMRKLSLESYVDVWIRDVEGTIRHTSARSTFLQARIDLVMIKSHSVFIPIDLDPQGTPLERLQRAVKKLQKEKRLKGIKYETGETHICPICAADIGKIFSLTGADPTFPHMNFVLPRHPNCKCYMVPLPSDIAYPTDEAIAKAHEKQNT